MEFERSPFYFRISRCHRCGIFSSIGTLPELPHTDQSFLGPFPACPCYDTRSFASLVFNPITALPYPSHKAEAKLGAALVIKDLSMGQLKLVYMVQVRGSEPADFHYRVIQHAWRLA